MKNSSTHDFLEEMVYRLGDLRDGRKLKGLSYTYSDISREIEELTGEKISAQSLNKYHEVLEDENGPKLVKMNVVNLVALAKFYNVSVDYLLCLSDSKERKNYNISKRIGLSDEAIETLENWIEEIITYNNGVYSGSLKKIPQNELSRMIIHPKFREIIYYMRSLKYLNDDYDVKNKGRVISNPIMNNSKVKQLKSQLGESNLRVVIVDRILNCMTEIINDLYPPNDDFSEGLDIRTESMNDLLGL